MKIKTYLTKFLIWLCQTIFAIGILCILAFIKLNISGSVQINTDIFRDSREILEIETKLRDLEVLETNNLPETIKDKR